uniref:Uncharacterized protein n=1 Tax=Candidatus Kentrum sp. FM TaxID=2126340 RepID=A0A450VZA3_9GAMM|nr:MAG: hypothetical protein BECKFM1743C_GA0114222_1001113 [Candidatus Kentron sp. FM]VFJ53263.1 MAG: hypothetical protein BECKFM1743A_GA0114220_101127 [Candidatus Kentron sp. FM]VFK10092.1 MAG: hypothetical protein BECKFM1743B_GA0114221_101297 [Candidatus Kentron sp. FM]
MKITHLSRFGPPLAISLLVLGATVPTHAQPTLLPPDVSPSPWSESEQGIHYNDGNVGIGTDSPGANLSIQGNLWQGLTGEVTVYAASSDVTGIDTLFTQEVSVGNALLIGEESFTVTGVSSDTALTIDAPHTTGAQSVIAYTSSALLSVQTSAGADAMVIDGSGNVGIDNAEISNDLKLGNKTSCEKLYTDASGDVQCGTDEGMQSAQLVCEHVQGDISASSDDSPSYAYCSSEYTLTGCACYNPWDGCGDGAKPDITNNRCVAYNSASGIGVYAQAICCKIE